jgi:streptogramin lyase
MKVNIKREIMNESESKDPFSPLRNHIIPITFGIIVLWVVLFISRFAVSLLSMKGWTTPLYAFVDDRLISEDGIINVDTYNDFDHQTRFIYVYDLLIDDEGQIWLATKEGVGLHDVSGSWTLYASPESDIEIDIRKTVPVAPGSITDLKMDEKGQLWIAAAYGVTMLSSTGEWTTYSLEALDVVDDYVEALAIDQQNRVLVGTRYGSILRIDADSGEITPIADDLGVPGGNNILFCLAIDEEDQIWVGMNFGLLTLTTDGNKIQHSLFDGKSVGHLTVDRQNRIWVGSSSFDSKDTLHVLTSAGRRTDFLTRDHWRDLTPDVAVDPAGRIWVLRFGELCLVTLDDEWTCYFAPSDLKEITIDKQGRIWSLRYIQTSLVEKQGDRIPIGLISGIATFDEQIGSPYKRLLKSIVKPSPVLILLTAPIFALLPLVSSKRISEWKKKSKFITGGYIGWFAIHFLIGSVINLTLIDVAEYVIPPLAFGMNIIMIIILGYFYRSIALGWLMGWASNWIILLYINLSLASPLLSSAPYYLFEVS